MRTFAPSSVPFKSRVVRAVQVVALLTQVERVRRGARGVLDPDVPLAGEVRDRSCGRLNGIPARGIRHDRVQPVGDDPLFAGLEHVRRDRHASHSGIRLVRREERDAWIGLEEDLRGHQSMRDNLVRLLSDADLAFELPGDNPTLGGLLVEMGDLQGVYTH